MKPEKKNYKMGCSRKNPQPLTDGILEILAGGGGGSKTLKIQVGGGG